MSHVYLPFYLPSVAAWVLGAYNATLMFALILPIIVVVMLNFAIAGRLERRLLRWN